MQFPEQDFPVFSQSFRSSISSIRGSELSLAKLLNASKIGRYPVHLKVHILFFTTYIKSLISIIFHTQTKTFYKCITCKYFHQECCRSQAWLSQGVPGANCSAA